MTLRRNIVSIKDSEFQNILHFFYTLLSKMYKKVSVALYICKTLASWQLVSITVYKLVKTYHNPIDNQQ